MARIRTIKPEFWTDSKIVSLPIYCRLLFIGMWNFADDDGWLYYEPESIKLQILPADEVDVDEAVEILIQEELVDVYERKEGGYALQIRHFSKHQKISHSTPSRIAPECSGKLQIPTEVRRSIARKYGIGPNSSGDANCYYCGKPGRINWSGYWVSFSQLEIDHFVPESSGGATSCDNLVLACRRCNRSKHTKDPISVVLSMIPEISGAFHEDSGLKGMEGNGRDRDLPKGKSCGKQVATVGTDDGFEDWWNLYPARNGRKRGKEDAKTAWRRLKDGERAELVQATHCYAADIKIQNLSAMDPPRFLKAKRWRDWLRDDDGPTELQSHLADLDAWVAEEAKS